MTNSNGSVYGYLKSGEFSLADSVITDQEGRYRISLSGEILNTGEISSSLGLTDLQSEIATPEYIIYRSYLKWGISFASRFKGSFLIVLYDSHRESLHIITDHFAKAQLYYAKCGNTFYFSSSLRKLAEKYPVSTEYSPLSLNYYLALRYIPGQMTIFKDIYKLPPSGILSFSPANNELEVDKYWRLPVEDPGYTNETELATEFEKLLKDVVKDSFQSGVNTGAFLSGGIDSGLIVALMSEISSEPVKTFTVGFDEHKYDERQYARIVSDYFGTDHNVLKIDPSMTEHFDNLPDLLEEPIGDPSIIPTYYSYKAASQSCDNMLCGEGADGLMLGLNTHIYTDYYARLYNRMGLLLNILAPIGKRLPDSIKWKIALEGLTPEQFFLRRSLLFGENERSGLFRQDVVRQLEDYKDSPEKRALNILEEYKGSLKGKMSYYNSSTVVNNALAMRVNLSHYFSIGYRTPFLDPELVSFIMNKVHPDLRIKNGVSKYLLKKVAKKYLPPDLPIERKRGFNPPFSKWFREQWWSYARERVLDTDDGLLRKSSIEKLFKRHRDKVADEGRKIFSLLMLRVWQGNYKLFIFFVYYFDEIEALV